MATTTPFHPLFAATVAGVALPWGLLATRAASPSALLMFNLATLIVAAATWRVLSGAQPEVSIAQVIYDAEHGADGRTA